jgi:hypothetical protein
MSDRPDDLHETDDGSGGGPVGTGGVEQRLRTQLGRHAADATVPEHGLDAIRGRIQRRRRNRQLLVGGSSLAVVLVLLVGALAIARPTEDSQPFVDTTGEEPMPLIGWDGDGWSVQTYAPMTAYNATDAVSGVRSDDDRSTFSGWSSVNLTVERVGAATQRGPNHDAEPVEVLGEPGTIGTVRWDSDTVAGPQVESLAVEWEPVPGWAAHLSLTPQVVSLPDGSEPPDFVMTTEIREEGIAILRASIDRMHLVDQAAFALALRWSGRPAGESIPPLVFDEDAGESVLHSYSGGFTVMGLDRAGAPSSRITLIALGGRLQSAIPPGSLEVQVRGVTGWLVPAWMNDENGERAIRWEEGSRTVVLIVDRDTGVEEALTLAGGLRVPTETSRQTILFPSASPPAQNMDWTQFLADETGTGFSVSS